MHTEYDAPKRARQSKSVMAVYDNSEVEFSKRLKNVKGAQHVKQHGTTLDDVSEVVRSSFHNGRLTRGKMKQIVDTIKYTSEQKTYVQKTDVDKETLLSREDKSNSRKCNHKSALGSDEVAKKRTFVGKNMT